MLPINYKFETDKNIYILLEINKNQIISEKLNNYYIDSEKNVFSMQIDNFIGDIKLNLISEININFDFVKIKETELNNLEKFDRAFSVDLKNDCVNKKYYLFKGNKNNKNVC